MSNRIPKSLHTKTALTRLGYHVHVNQPPTERLNDPFAQAISCVYEAVQILGYDLALSDPDDLCAKAAKSLMGEIK